MKNKILLLSVLSIVVLSSCFDQSKNGCPADMRLTFSIEDPYEPDTYDSRLGSDVMLYIFKDMRVVSGILITYDKIRDGKEYAIRKDAGHSGNLDLVAYAVPAGSDISGIPQLPAGDNLHDICRRLKLMTPSETDCFPAKCVLHMARITTSEAIDQPSKHDMGLNYGDCRMEVRVTDHGDVLSQPGNSPAVRVLGTMTSMNSAGEGVGAAAVVHTPLNRPTDDNTVYTTGRFGVFPSQKGQTVSVIISDGAGDIATLTVPQSALPQGAVPGGLIIFEYTIDATQFTITVDGFRQNIVIIDDM